jgi:hypothetical protein
MSVATFGMAHGSGATIDGHQGAPAWLGSRSPWSSLASWAPWELPAGHQRPRRPHSHRNLPVEPRPHLGVSTTWSRWRALFSGLRPSRWPGSWCDAGGAMRVCCAPVRMTASAGLLGCLCRLLRGDVAGAERGRARAGPVAWVARSVDPLSADNWAKLALRLVTVRRDRLRLDAISPQGLPTAVGQGSLDRPSSHPPHVVS